MFIDDEDDSDGDLLTDELESIADATDIVFDVDEDAESAFSDEPEGDMPIEQDEVGEEALETLSDAEIVQNNRLAEKKAQTRGS
ncbi:hypothetical protein [Thalassospira lucentensis]|nr:hypothetical protein [Thalassospira lucentensis]WOI12438.1 hypothetical protein R1T41_07565 [Thalassospira lucentensis]